MGLIETNEGYDKKEVPMGFDLYTTEDNIVVKLDAIDKASAIAYMVGHVNKTMPIDSIAVTKLLLSREQRKSSGYGKQIAFPHSINSLVPEMKILICTFKHPIQWDAVDGRPVKMAALILAPSRFVKEYVQTVADLCKILSNETAQCSILNMNTPAQIMTVLNSLK